MTAQDAALDADPFAEKPVTTAMRAKRIIALDDIRDRLAAQQKAIAAERADVEKELLEDFERDGIQNMTVDGRQVYLRHTVRYSAPDKQAARAALEHAGMEDFLEYTFNIQSVSAELRRRDRDGEAVPADLQEAFATFDHFQIVTKGGA